MSYGEFIVAIVVKNPPANAGDIRDKVGKIPWRRACNPLQYSCLENPMDSGAWQVTAHGVTRVGHDSTTKQ